MRTIRIVKNEKNCHTIYTKTGKDKKIGQGLHLISCLGFLQNVQRNLAAVGWSCRDVSDSKISIDSQQL